VSDLYTHMPRTVRECHNDVRITLLKSNSFARVTFYRLLWRSHHCSLKVGGPKDEVTELKVGNEHKDGWISGLRSVMLASLWIRIREKKFQSESSPCRTLRKDDRLHSNRAGLRGSLIASRRRLKGCCCVTTLYFR
jgi:hypothetical protein